MIGNIATFVSGFFCPIKELQAAHIVIIFPSAGDKVFWGNQIVLLWWLSTITELFERNGKSFEKDFDDLQGSEQL